MSHYENEIERLDLGGLIFDLSGKAEGLAYHASMGVKMYVTPKVFLSIGGGLGGSDQSISFELMTIKQEEDDFLPSYQVFAGVEYFPVDHFRIGLRYRWTKMEGMNLFSSQELHLAELSVGYSH
jgi:opacity protein-like surface antigen